MNRTEFIGTILYYSQDFVDDLYKVIERLNTNFEVANEDLTRIAQLLDLEEGCTIYDIEDKIERLKQGYCELKEKCNKGELDCTHEEYNIMANKNMELSNEIERLNNEIKTLLQENGNKEKVIKAQDNIIKEVRKLRKHLFNKYYELGEEVDIGVIIEYIDRILDKVNK